MHGHSGPPIGSQPPWVEWSRDRWRHETPKDQGRDTVIFEAAIKLFNFYHWQYIYFIYMDYTVCYWDALDRHHVRLNSILFFQIINRLNNH